MGARGLRLAVAFLVGSLSALTATAQTGTAFSYQGRLTDGVGPANGSYDMEFRLFNAASGSGQVGPAVTKAGPDVVLVTAGLFTVTLDFGAQFAGSKRWLEIGVRPAGSGSYTVLTPRQELTPVPNAVYAVTAGTVVSENDPQVGATSNGSWCVGNGTQVSCTASPPVTSETDPQVGATSNGSWCVGNGTQVSCTAAAPVTSETDPQVGATNNGAACVGNGSQVDCSGAALTTTQVNYSTPRTGYYNLHAMAFFPVASTEPYAGPAANGNYRYLSGTTTGSAELDASISLPHGVNLTDLSCWVYDNSTANILALGMVDALSNTWRCGPFSTSDAQASTRLVGGACAHVIDNFSNSYYLRFVVSSVATCGANCRIHGCRLTYTYTTEGR